MVTWQPAAQFARDKSRAWSKVLYVLKKGLRNVDLKGLHIFYNKKKNSLAMNTNELNDASIEQFWNKLKDDKREAVMYFVICENLTAMDNDENVGDNYKGINDKREYYFVVRHDNKTLNWSPNTLTDVDWSQQFEKLKNDVCTYFGLQVSAQMGFTLDGVEINNSEDIQNAWEEEVESSHTKSAELNVINAIKASDVNTNNTQNEKVRFFLSFFFFFFSCCFIFAIVLIAFGGLILRLLLYSHFVFLFFCFFVFLLRKGGHDGEK